MGNISKVRRWLQSEEERWTTTIIGGGEAGGHNNWRCLCPLAQRTRAKGVSKWLTIRRRSATARRKRLAGFRGVITTLAEGTFAASMEL